MADSEDGDFTSLPLSERLTHKLWKARMHGYQELNDAFQKASLRSMPRDIAQYWTSVDLFASYIVDSNVVAQEQAIAALLSLLQYLCQLPDTPRSEANRTSWLPLLAEKGLGSSRASTKQKSQECIMILVSLDKSVAPSVELLEPLLTNKLPRLVASCVECLAHIVESFGLQHIANISAFLPVLLEPLPRLCSHADRNVRSQSMNLILQLYKWLGRDLLQELLVDKLKPIQQKDLDKMFQKYSGDIPPSSQARLFQWQKQLALEQELKDLDKDKDGDTLMGAELQLKGMSNESGKAGAQGSFLSNADPFDLLPSTQILDKLPNDFQARITSSKWKDRVEVLDEVYNTVLLPTKKIESKHQDYSDFLKILANVIEKDANVQAVTLAAQCFHQLSTKLRNNFNKNYGTIVLTALLERSKEKKPSVNEAVCDALNDVAKYGGVDTCLEETLRFMCHKTPQVRAESTRFLTRLFKVWKPQSRNMGDELLIKLVPEISKASLKIVNDTQPAIRDSGFECLATLMKLIGEREVSDVVEKLDNLKKKRVYEYFDKVEVSENLQKHSGRGANGAPSKASFNDNKPSGPHSSETHRGRNPTTLESMNSAIPPFNDSPYSLRKPLSTLPSKRGPSSPLKSGHRVESHSNGLPSMKSRLTTRALTTDPAAGSSKSSVALAELEELKKQKQKWLKERQEFFNTITDFQNRSSQLNEENSTLQDQLNSLQSTLHERNLELRSKEMQVTRLQDRVSSLEAELEARTNLASSNYGVRSVSSFEPPSASLSEAIPGTPPPRVFARSASNGLGSPAGEIPRERNLKSRISSLNGRVRSPSESSDDLPRRVNSLQLRSEASQAERAIEASGDNFLNDESWKRAAEVTSQLKARIERMRAKTRGMGTS
ncbi:LADA_0G00672g1_1 [Lachancea dasiensis]|uniref:LADA_0G00672g1_1 n=1 Tax=Lachancea dasiensis TaxID=1072105 RepID=A0A1G4JQA0_9SACH|nr:LADA_0G00672g1_1 [Lachancea dasiensis]